MSSEQSLDPQLIEETKQQIRTLVNEIAQLSKAEVAPEEFYGEFLTRVVSALAAVGGAVWTTNDEGRLALQHQINLQKTNLRDSEERQAQHGRLLYKCLRGGENMLVPPHSGTGDSEDGEEVANPTDFLLVLGPLKTDLETVGVLEVFQRPETAPNTQRGYLRFLAQMCDMAADFLKSHQLRHFSDRQMLWTQLEDFTHTIHATLDPRETAYTICNEGRRLIECDRVSIAIRKGNKCVIEAVSGQDLFDKRSNVVRLLGKLSTAVVRTGEAVWYAGDTRDMAPQVEDAVQEYVDESHSKNVAVLPLFRPLTTEEEEDPRKRDKPAPPIGALIVEQIEDSRVPQSMVQRVEVVARHSAGALGNALEHQNLFLMPVWRALGKTTFILKARTLPKTIAISSAILAVLLFLFLWPTTFELHSPGTLEPVEKKPIYARVDGVVTDLKVDHGDAVGEDDLLVQLRSSEVDQEHEQLLSDLETTEGEIIAAERTLKDATDRVDRERLAGQITVLGKQKEGLLKQVGLVEQKKADLQIRSPIAGEVVTWDLKNRIGRRPVQRGQMLMEIADLTKDWELELRMPENQMGHVLAAHNEILAKRKEEREKGVAEKDLPRHDVTFILANDPDTEHVGWIEDIHLAAEVRGEEGNTVLIKVDLDEEDLKKLKTMRMAHQGAEVTAKVACGTRSIGYNWFHKLFEFIDSRILFPYF